MYAQVDKSKENKSRAVANSITQKKSNGKQGFGFVDNRPEAIVQRMHQSLMNNNRRADFSPAHDPISFDTQDTQHKVIQRVIKYDNGDGDSREKLKGDIGLKKGVDKAEQIIKFYEDHIAMFSSAAVYQYAMNPEGAPHNNSEEVDMKEPDIDLQVQKIRDTEPEDVVRAFLKLKREHQPKTKESLTKLLEQAQANPKVGTNTGSSWPGRLEQNTNRSVKVPTKKEQLASNSEYFPDGGKEPHIHYHPDSRATFTDTHHNHKGLNSRANIQAVIDDLTSAIKAGDVDVARYMDIINKLKDMLDKF